MVYRKTMAYEVFERTAARVESPTLAIVTDGRMALNSAATRALSEAGIKRVLLLWDKANCKLALKEAPRGNKNAYSVSFAGGQRSSSLRAKSFLLHVGWNASKRQRLPAVWNYKERMLEVSLPSQFVGSVKEQIIGKLMKTKTGL